MFQRGEVALGVALAYDWDGARTRRIILLKMMLAALATATIALVPAAILIRLA
jgi:hypothetical protein